MKVSIRKDTNWLILSAILLLSFWFRLQAFLYNSFAFTYDVGRDFLNVSQMLADKKPLLIGATTGLHGVFYGPTWYYILTPFFILVGGDPRGISFFMAVSGVVTAFFGYLLGKEISGKTFGILLALFIGFSQVLNQISAQIWNPNLIPLFVVISYILVVRKGKISPIKVFITGIILGVIFDLELVFGLIYFVASLFYIASFRIFTKKISYWAIFTLGFLLVQSPRILFELRHNFLMTNTLFKSFGTDSSDSLFSPIPQLSKVTTRIFEVFSQTVAWQNIFLGVVIIIFIIFAILKFYKKLEDREKLFLGYSSCILGSFIVMLSFFKHDIESHYYIGIPVIFVMLLGFSLNIVVKQLKLNIFYPFFAFIFVIVLNQLAFGDVFMVSKWIGDASVYRNQLQIVDYIYKDANGEKFNQITYTPPVHDYPYQYLFKWWGKKTYGYIPDKNYQKNFYIILEPDKQFPIRLERWLEERKKDGLIVNRKEFPSGIVVEKRFH